MKNFHFPSFKSKKKTEKKKAEFRLKKRTYLHKKKTITGKTNSLSVPLSLPSSIVSLLAVEYIILHNTSSKQCWLFQIWLHQFANRILCFYSKIQICKPQIWFLMTWTAFSQTQLKWYSKAGCFSWKFYTVVLFLEKTML